MAELGMFLLFSLITKDFSNTLPRSIFDDQTHHNDGIDALDEL